MLFSSICFGQKSKNTQDDVIYQKLARDIFRELIEINTTTSKGSSAAAEAMAARLRDDVRAHGKDERIGVDDFYQGVEFMYKFIKEVSIAAGLSHR
jgi:acetylornithine deacetylase/succinyl-diaminopimelate desuccinylase-like protein